MSEDRQLRPTAARFPPHQIPPSGQLTLLPRGKVAAQGLRRTQSGCVHARRPTLVPYWPVALPTPLPGSRPGLVVAICRQASQKARLGRRLPPSSETGLALKDSDGQPVQVAAGSIGAT